MLNRELSEDVQTQATPNPSEESVATVASLSMYDLPHLHKYNDALWGYIARKLQEAGVSNVPLVLTRGVPLSDVWTNPNLLLAQTCGYPLIHDLSENVEVVATPKYQADGCRGAYHRSCIIVRVDDTATELTDLRGRRCAVNEVTSNTGMNLLRSMIAPLAQGEAFFAEIKFSGSHLQSLQMVASAAADVCAIDCVTFSHLRTLLPDVVQAVRLITLSDETPCLPFVTAKSTDARTVEVLRQILFSIETDVSLADVRKNLFLAGFELLSTQDYEKIDIVEKQAIASGYPVLV